MVQEHNSNHHHYQQQQQLGKYGGGGGGGGAATGVARASRKNKPKKIPQRGLGVAQLEKLRIEEQKKMEGGASVPSAATLSSHALNGGGGGGLGHLPPLHHPPPTSHPLSRLSRQAADGGVNCGFPPVLWNPVDPMKHQYKKSMCPQPPLPMVSTGLSLTASSSHPTEPPSNQMYSSSSSRSSAAAPAPAEEDRETAGVDRSWPFMFEGMTAAAFRTTSKAPPPLAPFAVRTASESGLADVTPDLSRYEFRATNYFSAYANYSDWTSDFAHCKSSKESGRARDSAFLTLSSQPPHLIKKPHAVPSIHIPEYNDFRAMPSQQGSISASSQPFYSFLPVGPVRCERALSECKTDVSDGVDLELKLWKG